MSDQSTHNTIVDVVVVGGGINGVGIAADAAGRGLSVLLCEQGDLAGATSSRSSKLIHGGLRYLEHYEFSLVRDALKEREILLKKAPHIMWPLRFRLPHQKHLRPAWMIRVGLFLYDHLAKREMLAGSRRVDADARGPLVDSISTCFEYSDGWVDDARLVILNALQAKQRGAQILSHTRCTQVTKTADHWNVTLQKADGSILHIRSKTIVNAAGPWAARFINEVVQSKDKKAMRLVKGSHIIVKKMYESDEAYILQNKDGRIVFAIPYEEDFTLVGTTDEDYQGDPAAVSISAAEIDYILSVANEYFKRPISRADIVHHYSGVRPLLDEGKASAQELSRDYQIKVSGGKDEAIMVNIFGGKITTYRKLAEQAVDDLCDAMKIKAKPWTKDVPLPGGNFSEKAAYTEALQANYPFLSTHVIRRYVRSYGTLCERFLTGCQSTKDLGIDFGAELYQVEVDYLVASEWAVDAEAVLWRRSKLGLRFTPEQVSTLQRYIDDTLRRNDLRSTLQPEAQTDYIVTNSSALVG